MSLLEMPMRQQEARVPRLVQFLGCRHVVRNATKGHNLGRPFESRLHIEYFTDSHLSQLRSPNDLDCCFMAVLSWRKHLDPEL